MKYFTKLKKKSTVEEWLETHAELLMNVDVTET